MADNPGRRAAFYARIERFLNRGLPQHVHISLNLFWPLTLLPFLILGQLFTPHPVWITLLITLLGIYALGYLWVRGQATEVDLERSREGTILVAGDTLAEELTLQNSGRLPVLWAEFRDESDLPGYNPSQIVAAPALSNYRWRVTAECRQRGVFRIGPSQLLLADPFGFFSLQIDFTDSESLLIYPRIVQLPQFAMPHGSASGGDRMRRPLQGAVPSASIRDYRYGDSLRYIHWPSTAHRGNLAVKELELEPSGDVWIVLDLDESVHYGEGEENTLEFSIVVAASLTAELLSGGERRAVGLLTVSGPQNAEQDANTAARALMVPPQRGQAQLWRIMAALAPARATDLPLADLLHSSAEVLGHRRTVIVVTPSYVPDEKSETRGARDWTAELLQLQAAGLTSSVLLVVPAGSEPTGVGPLRQVLAGLEIPVQVMAIGSHLPPLLTYRRTRTEIRSTPSGGAITVVVEEEVG